VTGPDQAPDSQFGVVCLPGMAPLMLYFEVDQQGVQGGEGKRRISGDVDIHLDERVEVADELG
jgi:hypothetical protein